MDIPENNNYHDHSGGKPNKWVVVIILVLSLSGIIYSLSKSTGEDVITGRVLKVLSDIFFFKQKTAYEMIW